MFQRILVPLDGSTRAESAIPIAARIARASGASVTLVRVVTTPIDFSGFAMESPLIMPKKHGCASNLVLGQVEGKR